MLEDKGISSKNVTSPFASRSSCIINILLALLSKILESYSLIPENIFLHLIFLLFELLLNYFKFFFEFFIFLLERFYYVLAKELLFWASKVPDALHLLIINLNFFRRFYISHTIDTVVNKDKLFWRERSFENL